MFDTLLGTFGLLTFLVDSDHKIIMHPFMLCCGSYQYFGGLKSQDSVLKNTEENI